jgi:hypothetical protein
MKQQCQTLSIVAAISVIYKRPALPVLPCSLSPTGKRPLASPGRRERVVQSPHSRNQCRELYLPNSQDSNRSNRNRLTTERVNDPHNWGLREHSSCACASSHSDADFLASRKRLVQTLKPEIDCSINNRTTTITTRKSLMSVLSTRRVATLSNARGRDSGPRAKCQSVGSMTPVATKHPTT